MARPKNPQRTAELRAAAAAAVQRNGISGTTLRPLAAELGVSPRTLLYHFGSKEQLLVEVIRDLRHQQPHLARLIDGCADVSGERTTDGLDQAVRHLWRQSKRPEARPFLALYFELTSLAIRDPDEYRPLLADVDREWVEQITEHLRSHGVTTDAARALTDTLMIGYRGALGFALATGRWEAADASIAALLNQIRVRLPTAR